MSIYNLLVNQTANVAVPPIPVQAFTGQLGQPTSYQAFQAILTGSGSLTATVQPVGSNDGVNWVNVGGAIALSGTTKAVGGTNSSISYQYWGATVSGLTGTSASVNCTMSA